MEGGFNPRWRMIWRSWACRRWRLTSLTDITQSHSILQLGQLWTCIWRKYGGQGQGWQISGGKRIVWIWWGCERRLRRRNIPRGGGERDRRDGDGRLIKWDDTAENIILGTEPNAPLAYAPGLELHHPIMSTLGAHGVQLEI